MNSRRKGQVAGTGKSTLLRRFIQESVTRVDVTAPTGVAEAWKD